MTGHINKSNRAFKPELARYLAALRGMEKYFLSFTVCSISRTQNKLADELAKAAAQRRCRQRPKTTSCEAFGSPRRA